MVSTVELDPWGADTSRSSNAAFQPRKYTSYDRDGNASDEAMFRRYNRWHSRFDQPDPYDGSYDLTNPQSFNRYAYTQNDPVNFVDPSGLYWITHRYCTQVEGGPWSCEIVDEWVDSNDTWITSLNPLGGRGGDFGGGGPSGPAPQKPGGGKTTDSADPCAHLLPANIPPGISVDSKMQEARAISRDINAGPPDLGSTAARGATPFVEFMDFYRRVKGGGPWDYKLLDAEGIRTKGRSKYEEFGNFLFGATGAALGYPTGVLLRGAGLAQQQDANPAVRAKGEGVAVSSWLEILSNKGIYPYGDERADSEAIQRGVEYADCRRAHPH